MKTAVLSVLVLLAMTTTARAQTSSESQCVTRARNAANAVIEANGGTVIMKSEVEQTYNMRRASAFTVTVTTLELGDHTLDHKVKVSTLLMSQTECQVTAVEL